MIVPYIHNEKEHSLAGPRTVLPLAFADANPASLLDVGCGIGTWLKAALDFGITDIAGVDGVKLPEEKLHVNPETIKQHDLTHHWNLGRRFDAAVCVEVGEHLDGEFAPTLIDSLVMHSDYILFSAACPGQPGQHHVNCQWPVFWQALFNERGFECEDTLRWKIWDDSKIEPWYRQNLFLARRSPASAGLEPRIRSVVHPAMWNFERGEAWAPFNEHACYIEQGRMPIMWNLSLPVRALVAKFARKVNNKLRN
jgi:hypothetical protein